MSRENNLEVRGGTKLNGLIALALVVALIVSGVKIIPVYVRAYEFRDSMRTQAKFAGVDRKPYKVVREELFRKAKSLELPVARNQIRVTAAPGGITIVSRFTVPVDLYLFQYDINFDFVADTRSAF